LAFVRSVVAINLLLAAQFVALWNRRVKTTRMRGFLWFLLPVPLIIVFIRYLGNGMDLEIKFHTLSFFFTSW
jgi:hypothetical protein